MAVKSYKWRNSTRETMGPTERQREFVADLLHQLNSHKHISHWRQAALEATSRAEMADLISEMVKARKREWTYPMSKPDKGRVKLRTGRV